jgi:hypothetical protein
VENVGNEISMSIVIFRALLPSGLVDGYQYFEGICYLHSSAEKSLYPEDGGDTVL